MEVQAVREQETMTVTVTVTDEKRANGWRLAAGARGTYSGFKEQR